MANRTVSVAIKAEVAGLVNGLKTAANSAKQFGSELDGLGKKSPQQLHDIEMAAGGVGLALLGIAGYAVHAGMEFDKQMSGVKAATHASASEMAALRQAALDAGQATVFSATDAARAQTELAKAGLSTAQILGGGLKGALDLAAAGEMDVGEAAEAAATAMTQFKLSGKDIPHVADLLAAGAGKAQGEVSDMAMALKQGGLVANQFGVSIEETTGTLAAFASAGLIGSDAGTSFKQMLLMLANPSKEAAATMRELGIHAYDAQGSFVGIRNLAGQLKTQMSGLTQAQRDQALATIFGSDAIRSANVLYDQGADGIADWTNKVNSAGFAIDTAREKTDNLAGDLERLKGSLETLAISSGSGVAGGLRTLTQMADSAVSAFAALPQPMQSTATVLAGLGGAALLGTAGMLKLRGVVNDALDALKDMGPAGEKASGTLGKVASGLGKVAVGAAAAEAAILLVGAAWRAFVDQRPELSAQKLADALERVGGGAKLDVLGKSVEEFDLDLKTLANNGLDNFSHRWSAFVEGISGTGDLDGTFTKARADIAQLDQVLSSMVASGKADAAAAAFARIADEAKRQGISIDELTAGFPQYRAALDGATASEQAGIKATAGHEMALKTMAGTLKDAVDRTGSLKAALDQLNGVQINLTQAQINVEAAVDKLTESLRESGGSLDLNTEKGRAAAQSAIDLAQAAGEVAQRVYEQTGSVEQAGAVFDVYRQQLIENIATQGGTRRATDESRAAAKQLADQIMQIPPFKHIPITADTSQAESAARRLVARINEMTARIRVTAEPSGGFGGGAHTGFGYSPGYAKGGVRHAAVGMVMPPTNPGIVLASEPQTGGEVLTPLRGISQARAMSLSQVAGNAYGFDVVPRQANYAAMRPMTYGGGGGSMNITITAAPGGSMVDQAMSSWFMSAIRQGQITLATDDGSRVRVG